MSAAWWLVMVDPVLSSKEAGTVATHPARHKAGKDPGVRQRTGAKTLIRLAFRGWTGAVRFAMVGAAMEAIIDVVLPVFAIIASGWFCGRFRVLGDGASQALNGFTYFAALPALFFGAMATVPLHDTFNWPFIADYLGATVALGLMTWLIAGRLFPGTGDAIGLQNMSAL